MKRVVIYHDTALKLLQEMLDTQHGAKTMIICSTKEKFLGQLMPGLLAQQPQKAAFDKNAERVKTADHVELHPLLLRTLRLISNSKATKLAFCPTIDTLRAYLSSFATTRQDKSAPGTSLLVLDLILLHHGTSEFSVQGLMRSLASAVEAAARNRLELKLCECKDGQDLQNPNCGPGLWDAQVPLLSGSIRLRGEDAAWSQRVVSLRSVAGRWFEFEKKVRPRSEEGHEDEEMLV